MSDEPVTVAYFLMRQCGAMTLRCRACQHHELWDSETILRRVGRRGLGARKADLVARLRCAACGSADVRVWEQGDPHGFRCMNYLPKPERWAAFSVWVEKVLGPAPG